jgi:predicted nucleic acid-binding protein
MNIVIDTNIIMAALIRESSTRNLIINSGFTFLLPDFELIEIEKHKNEILSKSGLTESEFYEVFENLIRYVKIIRIQDIIDFRDEAKEIMDDIDSNDTPFIATALRYKAPIWSNDMHFKEQNRVRILTTRDIIDFINE